MAQKVIGLDLGSHTVKAVLVRMGLRGGEVVKFDTESVVLDEDGNSRPDDVFAAAGRLIGRLNMQSEAVHCAISGEMVSIRRISLPISAGRRMDQVLKFELDELLVYDIEDATFDYVEEARDGDTLKVLTATVQTDAVQTLLKGLEKEGVDPREVGVAPLAYSYDQGKIEDLEDGEIAAIIDLGHLRTNVSIIGDSVTTTRTILRGGRDLTARLASEGKVSFEEAEGYKIREGLNGKIGDVLKDALRPLMREIGQTLKGHLAAGGSPVRRIMICGGGSLLNDLAVHMGNELGVKVDMHGAPIGGIFKTMDTGVHPEIAVLAYALARREEVQRVGRFNVRRGSLAFKGDYEFLKRRAVWAAIFVLLILGSWIFSDYYKYSLLVEKSEEQKKHLTEVTTRLFGKPIFDRVLIEKMISGTTVAKAPMPTKDAFDIVVELSKRIPFSVVHDIELLDIKPKRITIKATVDSEVKAENNDPEGNNFETAADAGVTSDDQLSPTDLIQQKLSEFDECFTSIRIGKVQTVGERRKYQMDIESKCP